MSAEPQAEQSGPTAAEVAPCPNGADCPVGGTRPGAPCCGFAAGTAQGERVDLPCVHCWGRGYVLIASENMVRRICDQCRGVGANVPAFIAELTEQDAKLAALRGQLAEALELLGLMYSKYENGDPCYYDPENSDGYLGAAVRMEDGEEARVLAALAALDPSGQRGGARQADDVPPTGGRYPYRSLGGPYAS